VGGTSSDRIPPARPRRASLAPQSPAWGPVAGASTDEERAARASSSGGGASFSSLRGAPSGATRFRLLSGRRGPKFFLPSVSLVETSTLCTLASKSILFSDILPFIESTHPFVRHAFTPCSVSFHEDRSSNVRHVAPWIASTSGPFSHVSESFFARTVENGKFPSISTYGGDCECAAGRFTACYGGACWTPFQNLSTPASEWPPMAPGAPSFTLGASLGELVCRNAHPEQACVSLEWVRA
jgi:hypothetical protein